MPSTCLYVSLHRLHPSVDACGRLLTVLWCKSTLKIARGYIAALRVWRVLTATDIPKKQNRNSQRRLYTVSHKMSHFIFHYNSRISWWIFYSICTNALKVGLRISCEKMKAMSIGDAPSPQIHVRQHLLECVADFQYLGSYVSSQSDPDLDIGCVQDWAKLLRSFDYSILYWSRRSISNNVKFHLYSTTALHACGTWKSTAQIRYLLK